MASRRPAALDPKRGRCQDVHPDRPNHPPLQKMRLPHVQRQVHQSLRWHRPHVPMPFRPGRRPRAQQARSLRWRPQPPRHRGRPETRSSRPPVMSRTSRSFLTRAGGGAPRPITGDLTGKQS
ncbi:hypothetical protein SMACR_08416 [Sordaria macrospora]|uniref:Uncharacterized protein n=1 Tax=Sordaria macrospora TaxID=5147 RepID=A0A8S8ZJG8_SORMA|nr:hypothetical protein SMACR_08416 [Sordaria macrospora]WPJ62568.1 hypothetical protein SMAC4_08416 [Sordaria macrospora]